MANIHTKPCSRHRWYMDTCRSCNPYTGMTVGKLIALLAELPQEAPCDANFSDGLGFDVVGGQIESVYLTDDGDAVLSVKEY